MRVLLCVFLLTGLLWAQPPGRKTLEGFYEGLSLAADWKFAEGIVAHRSSDFEGVNEEGRRFDKWSDLNRYRHLFAGAIAVKCRTKILDFSQQGDRIVCTVKQDWEYTQPVDLPPKTRVVVETYMLQDTWVRHSETWQLSRSTVKSRSIPTWKT